MFGDAARAEFRELSAAVLEADDEDDAFEIAVALEELAAWCRHYGQIADDRLAAEATAELQPRQSRLVY